MARKERQRAKAERKAQRKIEKSTPGHEGESDIADSNDLMFDGTGDLDSSEDVHSQD